MAFASSDYDVIVAGGGPAGAAVATLTADAGHRVLLVERSPEPAFKVGESLMPACYWILGRMGALDQMKTSAFPKKYSVQFFGPDGRGFSPFYFRDTDPHECSQTWQVRRSEFDQMLLDNAAGKGVEVRRGVTLKDVSFDGDGDGDGDGGRLTGVEVEEAGDSSGRSTLGSKVFVDATGQSAFLARKLGLVDTEPRLKNVAFYTHYDGARFDDGIDAGATLILHTAEKKSWFWFIPQPGGRVSVGVVGSVGHMIEGRVADPETVFAEELEHCAALQPRLEGARRVEKMRAIRDFSYRSRRISGPGWVLAGDAFGFIDPIYSTGVFLALASGEMAADAINDALAAGDLSAERLGAFEDRYREGLDALKKLVYAYYDPRFSFAKFVKRYPHLRDELVDMLVGNVYRKPVDRMVAALDEVFAGEPTPAGA